LILFWQLVTTLSGFDIVKTKKGNLMILYILLAVVLLTSNSSFADVCTLKNTYEMHIVGEIHGSQESQDLQNVLIPAAMEQKVTLGIEIDEITLHTTLAPQFYDDLFATEEPTSKGLGLTLWAWRSVTWTLIKNQVNFIQQIENPSTDNAVSSFLFFMNTNSSMRSAVSIARENTLNKLAEQNQDLKIFIDLVEKSISAPNTVDTSSPFTTITSLETLKTLNLFFKEVLREYINIVTANDTIQLELNTPSYIKEFFKLIDHKDFDKNDPKFGVTIYNYDRLYRSLEAQVLFDWRSLKMAENVYNKLCLREAKNLPAVPVVVIAGAGHISYIEKILKTLSANSLKPTISVPPSSHSTFEKLFDSLKK
jgi:hypothetical protein